tara:strand:+ start:6806 stop:7546 length:741 start_codon:yes stop_codon:yes gene_type:complete
MANYWKIVNQVMEEADIILEVIDARNINETRNQEIEKKIEAKGKGLIYVINKCDLVDRKKLEKEIKKLIPSVYVSSKDHYGFSKLRERIQIEGKKLGWDVIRVGVLGYPNVGKSSIINALKGKKSAKTSSESGYTKGKQHIVIGNIKLIDTPGVFARDSDRVDKIMVGSIDYGKVKDPDIVVMDIMDKNPGVIEEYFGVHVRKDKETALEDIAFKKKLLVKGGEPDLDRVSRMILKMWQVGKIKQI